ncbi:MFS transporter [Nakamurella sp. GG22]
MATTIRSSSTVQAQLPWPALLTLGAATLIMVTAEMLPTAILLPMSDGLGVPISRTGQLVAIWAVTVVVASLPLTRLTRHIDRRSLLVAGLVALAVSSAGTALAPSYPFVVGARLLGGAAVGLLWATANAHVADLVSEALLGRAIAVVLGGATLGTVIGTPLARLIADGAGWRVAFLVLAVAALAIALLVRALVPGRPRSQPGTADPTAVRDPLRPALLVIVLVGLLLVGYYGAYTFITRTGEPAAALVPGGMSTLLLGYGLASAAGVALAGRVTSRTAGWLVASSAATALGLAGLAWAGRPVVGLVAILALGLISGGLPPLAQTVILRLAGRSHRDLAAALIPVVFNGGIAIGAAAASLLVARAGHDALALPTSAAVAVAALGLWWVTRARGTRDVRPPSR